MSYWCQQRRFRILSWLRCALEMQFVEVAAFKDTFGLILTILILLEFNHSIVSALRQRAGSIQVNIIVLITITVIARKLILLDYASASPESLAGLGGLALALGALYWLIAGVERRRGRGPLKWKSRVVILGRDSACAGPASETLPDSGPCTT